MPFDSTQKALGLMRRGRFVEASQFLEAQLPIQDPTRQDQTALLADALQRIGRNDRAESLCAAAVARVASAGSISLPLTHFVLGNIQRERGSLAEAAQHFQRCIDSQLIDSELACWGELRLATTVAEMDGMQAALARVPNVRAAIAECGDIRPFVAFHIWLAELESLEGRLLRAQQHLKRAESLVVGVDDAWLQGYLAVNSAVVHCYRSNMITARRWAELAIEHARISGHRSTRCAAYTTLGHIECSEGDLLNAEKHFRIALESCESGSTSHIAILDSIAQVQLEQSQFEECRATLKQIENLGSNNKNAKSRRYSTWALQTKAQLLLKEGRAEEARLAVTKARHRSTEHAQPLIDDPIRLLAAETLIVSGDVAGALDELKGLASATSQLPPDLLAQTEELLARALFDTAPYLSRVHQERAICIFNSIGHRVRSDKALTRLRLLPHTEAHDFSTGVRTSIDRFLAVMASRDYPEVLGHEAFSMLIESRCADGALLSVDISRSERRILEQFGSVQADGSIVSIVLGKTLDGTVCLTFSPNREVLASVIANQLRRMLEILVRYRADATETETSSMWTIERSGGDGVVFASKSMLSILETVKKVAKARISVLITGETGVGKEIIARTIHDQSDRAHMPFVALNCAAIPKELLESQLFGHRKGSFSGAHDSFQGIVRAANGGTVLLDEIGELTLDAQAKLLRFLESGEIHPLGEPRPMTANVRLLFATNESLDKAVESGRFRADLYYRIKVISVRVPSLKERREEIPLLASLFAKRFAAEFSKVPLRFSDAAMEFLVLHSWPGNIRQLANEIRRLSALTADSVVVTPELLSPEICGSAVPVHVDHHAPARHVSINLDQPLARAVADLEREMLTRTLDACAGQVTDAARKLGLSRKGLYLKRRRLGLGPRRDSQSRSARES